MRRQKANLTAAKVLPGKVYAVRKDEGLQRFHVHEVIVTRSRADGSPHDYATTVKGKCLGPYEVETLPLNAILGPFEEYQELVAKRDAEKRAVEEQNRAISEKQQECVRLLYQLTGLPIPNDLESYHAPIRIKYAGGVELDQAGVAAVLQALRKPKEEAA